jgi:hypothetical protein
MDSLHLGYIRKLKEKKTQNPKTVVFLTMAAEKQAGKLK